MFLDDNAAVHVGEAEVAEPAAFVHHGMIGHPTKFVRSDVKKEVFLGGAHHKVGNNKL